VELYFFRFVIFRGLLTGQCCIHFAVSLIASLQLYEITVIVVLDVSACHKRR